MNYDPMALARLEQAASEASRAAQQRIREEFQNAHPHYMPPPDFIKPGNAMHAWNEWRIANLKMHGPQGFCTRFPVVLAAEARALQIRPESDHARQFHLKPTWEDWLSEGDPLDDVNGDHLCGCTTHEDATCPWEQPSTIPPPIAELHPLKGK
jgi:hypothetical protein